MSNGTEQKSIVERLQFIDRRIIFVFIGLAVVIPLLFGVSLEEETTPIVQRLFDFVDALPEESRVLLSFDYGPTTAPEIQPMMDAILRQCAERKAKLYMMAVWATGHNLTGETIAKILNPEYPEYQYGIDYVNLGYKAGNQGLIRLLYVDFKRMYSTDAAGTAIDSIPMMENINSLKNFDLIISFGGGFPGIKEWILYAGDPGKIPVGGGCTAVSAPLLYPYYPNQLVGLLGGAKGAAEYEAALLKAYPKFRGRKMAGMSLMMSQTVAHLVIMLFILFGNTLYFLLRASGKGRS
ncbi:MAG: hypothetical protein KKG33_05830 [candidate division Zixibacteria bacterium]|nr:hypothetical protein [candidate division Zixibacteria bacterium]MBU1471026.1 hypothetical protein [candidate division Zixibacteria bacterium]MBU2625061.1 hypothetical protein [candidate division Zixibacteria bacterium]